MIKSSQIMRQIPACTAPPEGQKAPSPWQTKRIERSAPDKGSFTHHPRAHTDNVDIDNRTDT
eukprot:3660853-Pyramimonas_sp.AAC.1